MIRLFGNNDREDHGGLINQLITEALDILTSTAIIMDTKIAAYVPGASNRHKTMFLIAGRSRDNE